MHSTVLLVAGVVATTVVVPEVVWDLTDGAVGGGVLPLVAGAVLLAASLGVWPLGSSQLTARDC
ncbi:hypothetical protein [Lentzea waywayandensis]|uniref:hypothetical protein n=1 Tax=Lentzea waywayandensis TaxID=84724 RepID=UPI000B895CF5|nr:hypothetical protein [Lentzea waywayandensis]